MKSIKVTVLGRQYPLVVNPKDEKMMLDIASYVDKRFRSFKSELSNQTETTVMVLSCLSIAEEMFNARQSAGLSDADWEEASGAIKRLISEIKSGNSAE